MDTNNDNSFWIAMGNVLRRHRKIDGVSQEQLALRTDIDRRYLSDVEQGKRNVSLNVTARLASFFGLTLSEFIREVERQHNPIFRNVAELKEELYDRGFEDSIVLENPDYIPAVVGISEDGRVIYSYTLMLDYLMVTDSMTRAEAEEFIEYNTIRALPYMGNLAPIVMFSV